MADISITLPDGSRRTLAEGATATTVAESIGSRLAKAAVAAVVNGEEWDLGRALFDGAKFSIGPAIENGFYYDFDLPGGKTFSDDDLAAIEAKMAEIIKADQP